MHVHAESVPGSTVWYRDRPMRELNEYTYDTYKYLYRRMLTEIRKYIEKNITLQPLLKAEDPARKPPPPLFTPMQLEAIRKIIADHHDAYIAGMLDPNALPPGVAQKLIDVGLLPQDLHFILQPESPRDLPPETRKIINDAFLYGKALGGARTPQDKRPIESNTYAAWKAAPVPPLHAAEIQALDFAKHSAATRIKGLGNRIADDFTTKAIESDRQLRRKFETTVREELSENIEKRDSWRKLWSELGHASGDWSRDLARIASTEKMDAMIEGQARAMQEQTGDDPDEIRVAKQPNPDACPDCLKHYMDGDHPRIFLMSELMANGSNVGRKRAEWQPTLGTLHPYCACELIEVPSGWEFDEEGNLLPSMLKRSDFAWNLRKAEIRRQKILTYANTVNDDGIIVRVGDPEVQEAVYEVLSRTPVQVFTRATGVTLITTDHQRPQNPLLPEDYAYWTGNEIRLQQTLPAHKVKRVLEHELGHSLNVWLCHKLGDLDKVRAWHDKLWKVSQSEGWVTNYAKKKPIENAGEVTRLYLYNRKLLRSEFPRQFAMCHVAYGKLLKMNVGEIN